MLQSDNPKSTQGEPPKSISKWWKWWKADQENEFNHESTQPCHLAHEFGQGRFSDVVVKCFSKRYPLHRIILLQSPFFKRIFLQNKSQEIILEIDHDSRLNIEGLEIALRDLYGSVRDQLITIENASFVLACACYFEMEDLADFCSDIILTRMNASTIHSLILSIDRLAPSTEIPKVLYGDGHAYHTLLATHYDNLEKCCVSYLLQLASAIGFESTLKRQVDTSAKETELGISWTSWKSAEELLASFSPRWIKKVLEYDSICIESEFARYNSIKRVLEYKEHPPIKEEESTEAITEKNPPDHDLVEDQTLQSDPKSYLENILENVLPAQKKRKRAVSEIEDDPIIFMESLQTRETCLDVLKNHVHFIHVAFPNLMQCKNDLLLPESVFLRAFWDQAELLNRHVCSTKVIPEFRFAVRFRSIGSILQVNEDGKSEKTFCSDPIMCAGAQYRVILCRSDGQNTPENLEGCITIDDDEDSVPNRNLSTKTRPVIKALLQRTRTSPGQGATLPVNYEISYRVYCFDRNSFIKGKIQDAAFFEPFTVCNFDGSGLAKPLPLSMLQGEEQKKAKTKEFICDFWVTVLINFKV